MSSLDRKIRESQENVNLQDQSRDAPPHPPRSAFICFTDSKRDEIVQSHGLKSQDDILKILAEKWRHLSHSERAFWDEEARNDKVRFVREKSEYTGNWVVPKRRAKKHPLAPKRPMSAFLKFSQKRRSTVKERNPDMSNTDVSRLLGEMWRNASAAERAPYVEQEERERAAYKAEIQKWREEQAKLDAATRKSHREVVLDMTETEDKLPLQEQHHSRNAFRDPVNTFVSYEPISFQTNDETHATRNHEAREVYRSYNISHPVNHHPSHSHVSESHIPRPDAPNVYSYRFGGPYYGQHREHEQHYHPRRHYQDHRNMGSSAVDFEVPDRKQASHRQPHGSIREDPHYAGRSKYFNTGSHHHHNGYYHHP